MNARTLLLAIFALALPPALTISAFAESSEELAVDNQGQLLDETAKAAPELATPAEPAVSDSANRPVVAMDSKSGKAVKAGELFTVGVDPATLINRRNQKYELSPRSVAELSDQGALRLLRGSVVAESHEESVIGTAGAKVTFEGKALISYDHAEKSTSAFVLEGAARLENAHRADSSLRLARFHGATLVVGEVLPQLVRQLDVGSVQSWLAGYSWPAARTKSLLKDMPGIAVIAKEETPKHLEETKIEDYFSSIDTADEFHQPDYYDKKFDDPDKVVAAANSKMGATKTLTPEEAALIALPKTQIDLGFDLGPEFLSAKEKRKEVATVDQSNKSARTPASVNVSKKAQKTVKKSIAPDQTGDPEVNYVLERLRQVRTGNSAVSQAPLRERAPASANEAVVPDPVYDYSQNF
jgi:hypothetical protein